MKLYVTVGNDSLLIEGDVPVADMRAMFDAWIVRIESSSQKQIDELRLLLKGHNDDLAATVHQHESAT